MPSIRSAPLVPIEGWLEWYSKVPDTIRKTPYYDVDEEDDDDDGDDDEEDEEDDGDGG